MSQPPLISVIIPVYNGEKYIRECIDSILHQDFEPAEIIIINDGSDDRTTVILEDFVSRYGNIKVYSQENKGISAARNKGIELSCGEYLVFVDADDMLLPGALAAMYIAISLSDSDICVGLTRRRHSKSRYDRPLIPLSNFKSSNISSETAVLNMLYQKPRKFIGGVCGKMYRRNLFRSLNFREGMAFEDIAILPILYQSASKIIFIDFPVYFYRENPDSFLNRWSSSRLDIFKALESLKTKDFIIGNEKLSKALRDRELSAAFNALLLLDKYSINNPEVNKQTISIIKKYRRETFGNPRARIKNRIGAGLSYLGIKGLYRINRIFKIVR